ncbi:hypothetical protein RvY_00440 [Ramazzottius varieornatus]|uniref:Armadillo repeat-containing domain-containing protein n=1 Tax=Ramazzottius varieornatus TaxID=947166 RepID=A0A1D1UDR4_RAMVA|nr:hypothetical protein RvY_00440 [Ramazzottius varieornatus]
MSIVDAIVSPLVKTANFIRNGFHGQPATVQRRAKDSHVLTELEAQWMDPHKRKILETIEDFLDICKDNSYETSSPLVIETLHKICLLCYSANDFELIHKAQDIFPILIGILQNVNTPYALRLQIVSAVSILCHGNQVNCRTWCSKGGIKALLDYLRDIPVDKVNDGLHKEILQLNVCTVYTLRTLMCSSREAIKAIVGSSDFSKVADLHIMMYEMKDVWARTAQQQNYALDCCVVLGIGGKRPAPAS